MTSIDWNMVGTITPIIVAVCLLNTFVIKIIVDNKLAGHQAALLDKLNQNYFDRQTADLKINPLSSSLTSLQNSIDSMTNKLEARFNAMDTRVSTVEAYAHTARHAIANQVQVHEFRLDSHDKELVAICNDIKERIKGIENQLNRE